MLALLVAGGGRESATGSWTSTILYAKTELILLHGDFLLVEVILERSCHLLPDPTSLYSPLLLIGSW